MKLLQRNLSFTLVMLMGIGLLSSCTNEPKILDEIALERWTVNGDSLQYEKGEINYLEKVLYNEKGLESGKLFYNKDKKLEAKEVRVFAEDTGYPKGSQYKSAADSLLSYYTFVNDANGKVIESKAFDASNDELLRMEKFKYNNDDNLIEKIVYNALNTPVRIFKYTLDKNGNEMQVQVLSGDEKEILTEIFRITEYDDEKRWTEKWGFVNDQPFSYLARKIKYQE